MSHDAHLSGYTIRRPATRDKVLPAVGVGVAVGLAAFYVTLLLLEREPLLTPRERELRARALERRTGRRVSSMGPEMVGGAEDLELDEVIDDVEESAEELIDEIDEADRPVAWDRTRA